MVTTTVDATVQSPYARVCPAPKVVASSVSIAVITPSMG